MAGSFGGSVKLTGESEYTKALKTITSNLTVMASEMKLVSSQFATNDKSVEAITSKNNVLNKEIEEGNKKISTYKKALEDFNIQQDKNASSTMQMMINLEKEKSKLEELKNSRNASTKEIRDQEKKVSDLSLELAKSEAQYEKNKLTINKYQQQLNLAEAEVNNLTSELENNKSKLSESKSAYTQLNETIDKQKSRLNELKESYASSVLEQGKSSKESKQLKSEIKTLSTEIKNNETKLKESTKAVDDFSKAEDKAGSSTLKLGDLIKGNLISEGIIAGLKGLGQIVKSVVSGVANLGKQAIESYAEYEQLVGGVETLFKDSANIVQDYASKAYKTSGLSANQYMETVTSFSASLLQSLSGDTAKATEYADQAIIDMSDNANKMGTDISMIQSAYQGFAKQNFNMLDNLKLGYGGNKTEMERLIADANRVKKANGEMANLSINSFADITEAIHIIQTEMGITGTTAKEASSTISGSVNSMKSAWSNLVTGIADDNANFDELINNFVESIMTASENILPRISIALDGIVNLVLGLADKLLPDVLNMGIRLIQNLVTGITGNIGSLMATLNQVIDTLLTAFITMLPDIINTGMQVIVSLIQGIATSLPTLIPQIIDCVILIVETLIDNIDMLIDAGIQLIIGLAEGLVNALPKLIDKIPILIEKLITAITTNLPKIIEMGIKLTVQLAVGLIKAIPQLIAKIPEIITAIVKGLASGIGSIVDVGKNLVQGLWNGIKNAKDWVLDKIKGFGKSILNGIKSFFGINSPSKVFKDQIGTNLALGIGEGFKDEMSSVSDMMENSIPRDFDIGVNTSYGLNEGVSNSYSKDILVDAFKEALSGMTFKAFDEVFGELVIDNVEKVVYS